jgi:hypothetical protein
MYKYFYKINFFLKKMKKLDLAEYGVYCKDCFDRLIEWKWQYYETDSDDVNNKIVKDDMEDRSRFYLCRCFSCKRLSCIHKTLKCKHRLEDHPYVSIKDTCKHCYEKCDVKNCKRAVCRNCELYPCILWCETCKMYVCMQHRVSCKKCKTEMICGICCFTIVKDDKKEYYCKECKKKLIF